MVILKWGTVLDKTPEKRCNLEEVLPSLGNYSVQVRSNNLIKNENCIKYDCKEVFENRFDKYVALKTLNDNIFCDKSVEYYDESKKVKQIENKHSGKTETSTVDDKQKTITVKA